MDASAVNEKFQIDGELKETSWANAKIATDFVQYKPNPGLPSSKKTEVWVLYDDDALYVAAKCYDDPELVSNVLSQRDDFNPNIDNFQIILDTYNDDQNGFDFGVSSMGVQFDSKISIYTENTDLNMVWHSSVKRTNEGWQLEMRIPYSAIRFPKVKEQSWGINFFRYISHLREESTWNPVDPNLKNWIVQCGDLKNVQGIEPKLRLAFIPYISTYADHYPINEPGTSNWSQFFNGGMDIKYGINEAFTLDVTLVPDFGQVPFDNNVLNLSPFELRFNENRQFFTEGTEMFNKSGLFYSRRIGVQSPYEVLRTNLAPNESLKNVPESPQLLNATKLTGRTKKGLGIGVFNGITAEQSAIAVNDDTQEERTIVVSPLTNYNVLVLDQNLKNNSSITFTNTSVMRSGHFYDANVTGLNAQFNTKDNTYFISTKSSLSAKLLTSESLLGHNAGVTIGKQTGNLVFESSYFQESDSYLPNDLGFNANNNKRIIDATIGYRIFTPFWKLNQLSTSLSLSYDRLYKPDVYTSTYLNGYIFAITRKFNAVGIEFNSTLTKLYDYFESRTPGRVFVSPEWFTISGWISSNYQKRFALDLRLSHTFVNYSGWYDNSYTFSPRFRFNDKLFGVISIEQNFTKGYLGYAVPFGIPAYQGNEIVFGKRNQTNTISSINLTYTLTNRMGITFRLRHYRSAVDYSSFYFLNSDGTLQANSLDGLDENGISAYNENYNAFTIDFGYRWVFQPGSEMSVVWKNSIFADDQYYSASYFSNARTMFENAPLNSFSLKVLYWLDYNSLKRKKKK